MIMQVEVLVKYKRRERNNYNVLRIIAFYFCLFAQDCYRIGRDKKSYENVGSQTSSLPLIIDEPFTNIITKKVVSLSMVI